MSASSAEYFVPIMSFWQSLNLNNNSTNLTFEVIHMLHLNTPSRIRLFNGAVPLCHFLRTLQGMPFELLKGIVQPR